ncbi:MAG: ATP-dependent helicase, partial [Gemmatimonadota bacterium]|nr:ATP-dependent helicase [Gemmatimonadota bacterium]
LDTTQGGYAHRQLFELVQNSADALLPASKGRSILVRLTKRYFYCADDGDPIDKEGLEGLMFDRMSNKRNSAVIGRFGRGFKSVLRVTDAPEFFSRLGSFRFDKAHASRQIGNIAPSQNYPVLRLPYPIDPYLAKEEDEELQELMTWATNIVRLPLSMEEAYEELAQQIRSFPPEFLLFADHVRYLTLEDEDYSRSLMLRHLEDELVLDAGEETSNWRVFREGVARTKKWQ